MKKENVAYKHGGSKLYQFSHLGTSVRPFKDEYPFSLRVE